MNDPTNRQPIFLHALFRSGSTYLFRAFRRLGEAYTCFQEPLHEIALKANQEPELLNSAQDASKADSLRHPELARPYFAELYSVAGQVLPYLREHDIYDGYFGSRTDCQGLAYWQALIQHAPGRPVIQECRSSGRIAAIRHNLGGYHAYLWRNPWDQWWSYQVSPYFDLTTQLILNATTQHPLVEQLIEHIGFQRLSGCELHVVYDWFLHRPLSPEHSYQAFYALWLLALEQGLAHADLLINIDELSDSDQARQNTAQAFAHQGVSGLDFSDCHMPATVFSSAEQARFETLEQEVHQLWEQAGLPAEPLEQIQALRWEKAPQRTAVGNEAAWSGELARYRELIQNHQEVLAEHLYSADTELQAAHRREDRQREWIEHLEQHNEAERGHANALRKQVESLEAERDNSEALRQQVVERDLMLEALYASRSWRLTAPLRVVTLSVQKLRRDGIRAALASLVAAAEYRSRHYPRLRQGLLAMLARMPGVARRLRRLHYGHQNPQQVQPQPLTPRAREIYTELTAEIARQENATGGREDANRH
ncbi:hypothetical protein ACMDCT_12820 [Halomonadaceae bacterium KBTZ08]